GVRDRNTYTNPNRKRGLPAASLTLRVSIFRTRSRFGLVYSGLAHASGSCIFRTRSRFGFVYSDLFNAVPSGWGSAIFSRLVRDLFLVNGEARFQVVRKHCRLVLGIGMEP